MAGRWSRQVREVLTVLGLTMGDDGLDSPVQLQREDEWCAWRDGGRRFFFLKATYLI